jgi:hypothetical protein
MSSDIKDFRVPWTKPISKQEWKSFLDFNFDNPSRPVVYELLSGYFRGKSGISFLEIGFGQCRDFDNCFRAWHDTGVVIYRGVDITEQFVRYAREEYPQYDFAVGGFTSIDKTYDIVYTSQTLEHQHPDEFAGSLKNMLDHTKSVCMIVWFQSPRPDGYSKWSDVDGFGGEGAWVNRYNNVVVSDTIKNAGFNFTVHTASEDRSVYFCERVKV